MPSSSIGDEDALDDAMKVRAGFYVLNQGILKI